MPCTTRCSCCSASRSSASKPHASTSHSIQTRWRPAGATHSARALHFSRRCSTARRATAADTRRRTTGPHTAGRLLDRVGYARPAVPALEQVVTRQSCVGFRFVTGRERAIGSGAVCGRKWLDGAHVVSCVSAHIELRERLVGRQLFCVARSTCSTRCCRLRRRRADDLNASLLLLP